MEVSNSDIMAVRPIIVQHGSADTVVRAMNVKYRK